MLLEHLGEPVLVLDRQRNLKFINDRARKLLGFAQDEPVGGRCRLTTRGADCEQACPLTFALDMGLEAVEGFSTVYTSRDGRPVSLSVTVIPLKW